MQKEQEVLDEIFGPGPKPGPKAGGETKVPDVDDIFYDDGTIRPPTGPTVKTPVEPKKVAAKVPVAHGTAAKDPAASPYTSGYGQQSFPLGMEQIGTDSVLSSGIKAFDEKRFEDALNYFEMVLRTDKTNPEAQFFRIKTRERLGLPTEEGPKEERILTREESLAGTDSGKGQALAAQSATGGVYRMPTLETDHRKHEMARAQSGIDPSIVKLVVVVGILIGVGLAATAFVLL